MSVAINFDEKTTTKLDLDGDGKIDHATVVADSIEDGSAKIAGTVYIDLAKDGFSKNTLITRSFSEVANQCDTMSAGGQQLRFDCRIDTETLVKKVYGQAMASKIQMQKQQLDKEIAENAGTLGALRDDSTSHTALGATGLNADDMKSIVGNIGTKGEGGIGTVSGDHIVLGALDKSLIDAVINRNMTRIHYAYDRELPAHPDLTGKVTIKFVIARDGNVSSTTIKTGTDEDGKEYTSWNHPDTGQKVGEAICQQLMKFQFPEPKGGGFVIVSYPFVFSPE